MRPRGILDVVVVISLVSILATLVVSRITRRPVDDPPDCGFCTSSGCAANPGDCTACCHPSKCPCLDSPASCSR